MIIWDGESSRKFIVVKFLEKYLSFAYDGYKLIEERNALDSNVAVRKYVWQPEAVGQDVPLSMTDVVTAKNYTYTLDANKNVSDLTDAQGNVVAHYEYSPFGTHTATGSYTGNPFRFSSEVFDSETGLIYYNYRYYNPNLGRWINRDPIEEQGGWNLYVMIGNNVNNKMDKCGLLGFPSWDPRTWNRFHWYGNWGGPGWAAGGWVEDGWSNEPPGKKM